MFKIGETIAISHDIFSTKEMIISTLFQEWPLTTKGIYQRVKRLNGNGITYQAVHKHLKKLLQQGILAKNSERYYIISKEWLDWVECQVIGLKQKYQEHKPVDLELNQTRIVPENKALLECLKN